jgi:copper chaperone
MQFKLPDMTCGHCASTVTKSIQRIDPGATVNVDLTTKNVTVESNVDRAAIAAALTEAGYAPAA